MYGFVKKGLLVSIASSALILGGAGFASAADGTSATGSTSDNGGAVSGNVIQGSGDVPISVCGDTATVATAKNGADANSCSTKDEMASITGSSTDSGGLGSGNVAGVAASVPIQACGLTAGTVSADSGTSANTCKDDGTSAMATGSTSDSWGLVTGNVVQAAVNAPIQACGDSLPLLADFASGAHGNTCSNS